MFHTIEDAIHDLKSGKPVIVVDDENRENEGDLIALGENVTPEIINFMITKGKGLVCMPITSQLSEKLSLNMMETESTDPFGTAFTVSIDHKETSTGISAFERAHTIESVLNEHATASDFRRPGHIFPLIAKDGGVLRRQGHTEAAVDLALLSGASPVGVICEIIKQDGTMARVPDLKEMAKESNLKIITIKDLIMYRKKTEKHVQREVETVLPSKFGDLNVYGYSNWLDSQEHIAFVLGHIDTSEPVLTRVHSECLTGDVFGSYRCDCGSQLEEALTEIKKRGSGVLIYMRQEGRGIGLMNKLRAYHLQDKGMDTVEANEQLGFPSDMREYGLSAQILNDLGVRTIDLLTNNPEKISALESYGMNINQRIPLETPLRDENEKYMHTKAEKMGHLLNF